MTGITLIMALKMGNTQKYNDKNDLYLESEHCKQPTYININTHTKEHPSQRFQYSNYKNQKQKQN
jgi:hypothetical protein